MKIHWRAEFPHWMLLFAICLTSLIALPQVPDRMPIHWNASGEVDGYGSRLVGLGMMPLLAIGLYFLLLFIPRIDPGKSNFTSFARVYWIIRLAVLGLLAIVHVAGIMVALGFNLPMNMVVFPAVGLLLIVLGNYMSKIRPNWFVGVRTPWTLSSKVSWEKTHRQASWWMIAMGVGFASCALVTSEWYILSVVGFTLLATAWLFVYSYLAWRDDPDKIPPAGVTAANRDEP